MGEEVEKHTCEFCSSKADCVIERVTLDMIYLCEHHYFVFADMFDHFKEQESGGEG